LGDRGLEGTREHEGRARRRILNGGLLDVLAWSRDDFGIRKKTISGKKPTGKEARRGKKKPLPSWGVGRRESSGEEYPGCGGGKFSKELLEEKREIANE